GYETDRYETVRRSIGHQYALGKKTSDRAELERILVKLCEKVGRRLRKNNYYAAGVHLYLSFVRDRDWHQVPRDNGFLGGEPTGERYRMSWHLGHKTDRLYSTHDIFEAARRLLAQAEIYNDVRGMSVTV